MGKFRTAQINAWVPVVNEDTFKFPAGVPLRLTLRSYGPCGVMLVLPEGDLLVLGSVENGEAFIEVPDLDAKEVQFFTRTGSVAAFRTEGMGHTQVKSDEQTFTVLKPRIVMSDEMRMMQQLLRQQRADFERKLQERDKLDARHASANPVPKPTPSVAEAPAPAGDEATSAPAPASGDSNGA